MVGAWAWAPVMACHHWLHFTFNFYLFFYISWSHQPYATRTFSFSHPPNLPRLLRHPHHHVCFLSRFIPDNPFLLCAWCGADGAAVLSFFFYMRSIRRYLLGDAMYIVVGRRSFVRGRVGARKTKLQKYIHLYPNTSACVDWGVGLVRRRCSVLFSFTSFCPSWSSTAIRQCQYNRRRRSRHVKLLWRY